MQGRTASLNAVIAGALWTATGALLLVAIAVTVAGHWKAGLLISETACVVSTVAAVRHIRCYATRVCQKIDDARQLDADIRRLTGVPGQRVTN